MKPTMGRIVRYTSSDGEHERPARIVSVSPTGNCNLIVDLDGPNDPVANESVYGVLSGFSLWLEAVAGGDGPPSPGQWRWPPRE